ncbi:TetR/AcrR family transcriptional regulator [Microbacterium sp.]|uniref:TetR/AcrR family transcriptional regulator n=1 Tax=Microbacterium sp. TaxID=51671 RepID=UPI0039E72886
MTPGSASPAPDAPARRGAYAKGVAKREEILARSLEVIARSGYRGASVKELAEAAGLSQAGLLHYFGSKEELFTAILRKRDEVDSRSFGLDPEHPVVDDVRGGYVGIVQHNAEVPGLVQLFAQLSVDAADPEHPAHRFFLERNRLLREAFGASLARRQAEGRVTDRVGPDTLARLFQAVADGLQVQWMLEPDLDMAAIVGALFDLVERD